MLPMMTQQQKMMGAMVPHHCLRFTRPQTLIRENEHQEKTKTSLERNDDEEEEEVNKWVQIKKELSKACGRRLWIFILLM
mmetsp:Transcript_9695/g.15757  ORF Transcript_9695/g.15757 Transcript_9695/m.15757 type:complete len:80 (-) Transcript_9695:415-654(-)